MTETTSPSSATNGEGSPFTVHRSAEPEATPLSAYTDAPARVKNAGGSPFTRLNAWFAALRDRLVRLVAFLSARRAGAKRWVTPPNIATEPRPSLSAVWGYARAGDYTHAEGGPVRNAGVAYGATVVTPAHAVGYMTLWVIERASRLVPALALVRLAWEWPPVRMTAKALATPVRWFFGL